MSKIQSPGVPQSIINADKKFNEQYLSLVKKSNLMIRKARYSLSLQQQKVLCYLITHLSENDTYEQKKFLILKLFMILWKLIIRIMIKLEKHLRL